MPRYKLTLSYDGTPYHGWQRQQNHASVQQAVEEAVFAFCQERVGVFAAGRTDAGVHAYGQVAHLDLSKDWAAQTVRNALNAHLLARGEAVAILDVQRVEVPFHARFSARKRHYLFKIFNHAVRPVLEKDRVWWVPFPLDAASMHEAAQLLCGYHDFSTFRAKHCQAKSPYRHLDRLDVHRKGDMVEIYASAPSFLHNQIRSFVGSLVEVGRGKWLKETLSTALKARDRTACGPLAPPQGLYFVKVDY